MNGFGTALRAEFYVSLRSFSGKLIVLAPSILVMIQYLITKLSETGQQARDSLLGSSSFSELSSNAYGYYVDGMSTGITLLGLLLVAYAAFSISSDRDTGVIRHLLIRRISRSALLIAKLVHIHCLAALSLLLLTFVTYFGCGLLWEYGAIVEDGFELISVDEITTEISLGIKLALTPLPAAIAFGLLVSVCTQSTTQAVTSALGITILLDVFKSMLGDYAYYLYATFQPSLLDQSYLQDVSRIVRGYSDVLIDDRVQQLNLWVPLPEMVVFLIVGLFIIQRRKL
jgi:ABC-type transport system involved in multi-copper enzyme maturation permease subunit|tara:strand:+ start:74 stop:928 length:855 start_codon:yes stop_codon:yes gene_type:complete